MAIERLPNELNFVRNHYGYNYGNTPVVPDEEEYDDDSCSDEECCGGGCMADPDPVLEECSECNGSGVVSANHHDRCTCEYTCQECDGSGEMES